jgi:NAD(P)-dependent dehydrogenase (short-subunit alcohol dehydrogenase family)
MVIVTGASRGIGAAIARLAGRAGYPVCVNFHRNESRAQAVVAEIAGDGGTAIAVQADVGREQDVRRLFEVAERELGPLGGLVNNAGSTGGPSLVTQTTTDQIEQAFRVNLLGTMVCTREALLRMSTRHGGDGGAIVNVTSTAARTGGSFEWVHYAAMKAALNTFTRGAAVEVAEEGVRVNAVAPGLVSTDLHADNGMPDRPERLRGTVPMQRLGTPEEIAHAVLWFLSDEASYVTGAVLEVSGGR